MAEYAPITKEHGWFIGEKKSFQYTIKNQDGSAADISTWDLEWTLRPDAESPTVYIQKKSTSGGEISKPNPTGGVCQVTINPADYDAVVGAGTFDKALKRTDGDNDTTLAYGEAVLQASA
jgi:hypothetical protein